MLWTGVAIIAFPVLEGWQLAMLVSPATWGGDEEYGRYKAQTPVLWPRRPG